ncbi:protein YhfH [Bacillus velezensis]
MGMLEKMSDFFRNLPDKKCEECGNEIVEQYECHINLCNDCLKIKDM